MQPTQDANGSQSLSPIFNIVTTNEIGKLDRIGERLITMFVVSQCHKLQTAAAVLGIGVRTLQGRMRKYGFKAREIPKGVFPKDKEMMSAMLFAMRQFEPALTAEAKAG